MTTKRPLKPMLLTGVLAIGMAGIGLTIPGNPALGMPAPTESVEPLRSPYTSIDTVRRQVQRDYGRQAKEALMKKKESSMSDAVHHQVEENTAER